MLENGIMVPTNCVCVAKGMLEDGLVVTKQFVFELRTNCQKDDVVVPW